MVKRKPSPRKETISDQLRRFIRDSGISRNQLCKLTGMDPSHLHRFYHGTGRLTNDVMDKLADALRLRLVKSDE
jgi:transcriptional regulator with XRE-family HTH domain